MTDDINYETNTDVCRPCTLLCLGWGVRGVCRVLQEPTCLTTTPSEQYYYFHCHMKRRTLFIYYSRFLDEYELRGGGGM